MKIIDNRKDYYDWLVSVWGIDENLVFDRRSAVMPSSESWDQQFNMLDGDESLIYHFWIGDEFRVIYYDYDACEWVIAQNIEVKHRNYTFTYGRPKRSYPDSPIEVEVSFVKDFHYYNRREIFNAGLCILREFRLLTRMVPANDIWKWITDYLSKQKDKEIVDDRNDVQKLESVGFDKKTSFRNVK